MEREEAIKILQDVRNSRIREAICTLHPELRESEDERIRKMCIAAVNIAASADGGFLYHEATQCLDWLEKQKEQKPADDKAFEEWIDDWWKHNKVNNPHSYDNGDEIQFDERGFKNFCRGIRNMYQQKPAEWSEEDEDMLVSVLHFLHTNRINERGKVITWVESLPKRFSLQPKQEWSEEDEKMIETICKEEDLKPSEQCWLKFIHPQSKDEIYKEKNKAYKLGKHHLAVKFMNYLDENRPEGKMGLSNSECEDIDKAFKENDWAKIMRYVEKYSPSWKPSEEQMEALEECGECKRCIKELYEQLNSRN